MGDAQVIAFTVAAAVLTVAPGANDMLVIRNVLRGGRRDGIVAAFGICAGLFVHATLSALGVSMLLMHSATAFHLVKLAGGGLSGVVGRAVPAPYGAHTTSTRLPGGGRAHSQKRPAALLPGRLAVECAQSERRGVLSGVFAPVHRPDRVRAPQVLAPGEHSLCRGHRVACHIVDHARSYATVPPAVCGASLAGWSVRGRVGWVWGTPCARTPVARSTQGSQVKASTQEHLTIAGRGARPQSKVSEQLTRD